MSVASTLASFAQPALADDPLPHSCRYCERVLLDPTKMRIVEEPRYSPWHIQALDIQEAFAAEADINGCAFFAWVRSVLKPPSSQPHGAGFQLAVEYSGVRDRIWAGRTAHFVWLKNDVEVESRKQAVINWKNLMFAYVAENAPVAKYIEGRPFLADFASEHCFDYVKAWVRECRKSHRCGDGRNSCPPRRLLDVGNGDRSLRLSSTAAINPVPEYCCLSYCWGGDQPMKTLQSNIREYEKALPESQLPQTLQDAAQITRRLGFRYLWIDALCIIQDDDQDKAKEIINMASIYSAATVTVVAGNGRSCWDGFLDLKRAPQVNPDIVFRLRYLAPDGRIHRVNFRNKNTTDPQDDDDPIHGRAWTLQEHLYSPRVLFYGSRLLKLICFEKVNQYGLDKDPASMLTDGRLWTMRTGTGQHSKQMSPTRDGGRASMVRGRKIWQWIVRNYTFRHLTFGGDKLLAISSIAEEHGRLYAATAAAAAAANQPAYLAGLWRHELPHNLLWSVDPTAREGGARTFGAPVPCARPPSFRAPSWSWAAVDGPVVWRAEYWEHDAVQVQALAAAVDPAVDFAPFGAVVAPAHLSLRGRLKKAVLSFDGARCATTTAATAATAAALKGDLLLENHDAYRHPPALVDFDLDAVEPCFLAAAADGLVDGPRLLPVWCLEILRPSYRVATASEGLLLLRCCGADDDDDDDGGGGEDARSYRRVGTYRIMTGQDAPDAEDAASVSAWEECARKIHRWFDEDEMAAVELV